LLWAFASGADESIANIDLDAAMPIAAELNACRLSIARTAKKLAEIEKSDKSVEGLIKEAADEVLATERPMFVLDNGQGTF
jgi:F420-0:gamma-glutamyl ligase